MEITKYVLPVVVGAMSGMILITVGEKLMETAYPLLPDTDRYDAQSLAIYVKQLPQSAFGVLTVNNIICSFLAGIIATLIAARNTNVPAIVVGIVLTLAGLYKAVALPNPLWYSILNLLLFLPLTYLGYLLIRKKPVVQ